MRIADVQARTADLKSLEGGEVLRTNPGQFQTFSRQLSETAGTEYQKRIADMVEGITRQGKLLSQRTDLEEFIRYREMISELMHEVVSNAYAFNKRNAFDARGRHRIYAVVHKVNGRLDELAREVLNDQQDNLKILEGVEDIRGMLVDMLL